MGYIEKYVCFKGGAPKIPISFVLILTAGSWFHPSNSKHKTQPASQVRVESLLTKPGCELLPSKDKILTYLSPFSMNVLIPPIPHSH